VHGLDIVRMIVSPRSSHAFRVDDVIGHDVVVDANEERLPGNGKDIGAPPPDKASPGRANAEGQVVLYVADQPLIEVRSSHSEKNGLKLAR
jgi:hypothetical protein